MYSQPYALFEAHERSQIHELEPAIVTAIDRAATRCRWTPSPVCATASARGAAPGARDWYATVESTEPIGECLKKFPSVN